MCAKHMTHRFASSLPGIGVVNHFYCAGISGPDIHESANLEGDVPPLYIHLSFKK